MMELVREGGYVMYPLLIIGGVVVALATWATFRLVRGAGRAADPVLETGIDATLFWGGWAVLLGLLGTFVGIYQAAGAIQRAGGAEPAMIWGGIQVALTTTLFGLVIFIVAALLWFALRTWYRGRIAA
jgi:biopolymer transport protein ExbB/TolQ